MKTNLNNSNTALETVLSSPIGSDARPAVVVPVSNRYVLVGRMAKLLRGAL